MMKKIISFLIFLSIINNSYCEDENWITKLNYGLEFNKFQTTSGFGECYEINIFAFENLKKALHLGMFYDIDNHTLSGINVMYRYILIKHDYHNKINIEPYAFYNLIYRITSMDYPLCSNLDLIKQMGYSNVTYKSIEHTFGFGFKLKIFRNFFIHIDYGFGRYLGSIKKPGEPDPNTSMIPGTDGFTPITKL